MNLRAYARLTRGDVTVIAFVSYLFGSQIAAGLEWLDLAIGLMLALISTNFIYVLNAWADRDIDRVNQPQRPVACGEVSPSAALRYALVLFGLSLVYPFFVARSGLTLGLFLLLPLLGVLYSVRPFWLKRFSVPAILITSIGLVTPVQIGYFLKRHDAAMLPFFAVLFVYCLSVIVLKDIQDADGDHAFGLQNVYVSLGSRLLVVSLAGLALAAAVLVWFPIPRALTVFMAVIIASSAVLIVIRRDLSHLYGRLIKTAVAETVAMTAVLLVL